MKSGTSLEKEANWSRSGSARRKSSHSTPSLPGFTMLYFVVWAPPGPPSTGKETFQNDRAGATKTIGCAARAAPKRAAARAAKGPRESIARHTVYRGGGVRAWCVTDPLRLGPEPPATELSARAMLVSTSLAHPGCARRAAE